MLADTPQAIRYLSDAFGVYARLVYDPGRYRAMPDQSETYFVEADNAEWRPNLARRARRSRCFSRCIDALRGAIKLFVHAWDRRQLFKRAQPAYSAHVCDFLYP
jgi:IS1 family transposase